MAINKKDREEWLAGVIEYYGRTQQIQKFAANITNAFDELERELAEQRKAREEAEEIIRSLSSTYHIPTGVIDLRRAEARARIASRKEQTNGKI